MKNKKIAALRRELAGMPEGMLHIKRTRRYLAFVEYLPGNKERNIKRDMDRVHLLARKAYLIHYIAFLENPCSKNKSQLEKLLTNYADASLDMARITMTKEQLDWMRKPFKSNPSHPEDLIYATSSGVLMRSKSERDIGNMYEKLGIPYRYEMALTIDVKDLVDELASLTKNFRRGQKLYSYVSWYCYWNVPEEYQWMNLPGSIWRLYDANTHTITIYPDFNALSFDGNLIVHEHEGLTTNPTYRCNSSERIFVMRHSGAVLPENLFMTFERDILDTASLEQYLRDNILSKI